MRSFSATSRIESLRESEGLTFDVAIIGGGITGAGIALEAASKGYRVFLCDSGDFASGTSSKSTKLIHGGLRYLKNLQFGVVRQTGVEREILYRNAMHLVRPEPMLLPVVQGGSLGMFSTRLALWVYESLAGVKPEMRFKMLSKEKTLRKEPLLDHTKLLGSALYTEYRTDDARLCISVLKKAVELEAVCVNYAPCKGFITNDKKRIEGVLVEDFFTGIQYKVKARFVVNASGPWVDLVRNLENEQMNRDLVLSKGVHLVFPYSRLPVNQAVYFDAPDGRMIFAIPRGDKTYVGTTDTPFEGNPGEAGITKSDREYLIEACNQMFPGIALRADDMISSWTGLRPLISKPGKGTAELSRKDEIFVSPGGLISIAGGKLTGYRSMAEKVMKKLFSLGLIKIETARNSTRNLKLSGGSFEHFDDVRAYLERQIGEAKQIGASPETIASWVNRYGSETEKIVEMAYEIWPQTDQKEWVPLFAEITYAIHYEMACSALDFWERRTGDLYFNFGKLDSQFQAGFNFLCNLLQLGEEESKEMKYNFYAAMDRVRPPEE